MTQFQSIGRTETNHLRVIDGKIAILPGVSGAARASSRTGITSITRPAAPQAYRTRIATGSDALRASLAEMGPEALSTPFQTASWINTWLNTIGKARDCDMHVAEIRDERNGELLFALPLLRRRAGVLRVLELPDFGLADYVSPVLATSFRPDRPTMAGLWNRLMADLPAADLIRLNRLPERIGHVSNPLMMLGDVRRHAQSAWSIQLEKAPDTFGALGMVKKRARELDKRLRRMAAIGPVEFRVAGNAAEADRFFNAMCAQRARRHAEMGRPNSLEQADVRAFFHAMLAGGSAGATACIQAVLVNDEIVATGYGLQSAAGFHVIFATIEDGPWRPLSPGLQYFRMSMAWACRNGSALYDFTIGSEQYKAELGAREMPLYEICQPLSHRGRLAATVLGAKRLIRRQPRLAQFLRHTARSLNLRSI